MPNKYQINKIYDNCEYCKKRFRKKGFCHSFCSKECNLSCNYRKYKGKIFKKIYCKKCKEIFLPKSKINIFCSSKCRANYKIKKHRERGFVSRNRKYISEILGISCFDCKKYANEIHHKTYNIPVKKIRNTTKNLDKFVNMLIEYCKYLLPACTKCHRKEHLRIIKENILKTPIYKIYTSK